MKIFGKIVFSSLKTILFVFVISFLFGLTTKIAHSPAGWDGALLIALFASAICAISLVAWGIPVHLILSRWGKDSAVWYMAAALFPGIILAYVIPFGKVGFYASLSLVAFFGVFGVLAALVFRYFVRR